MRCEDIQDRLIDVGAPGLVSAEPEVRRHLEMCRDCRASVERATRAWTLLSDIPEAEPDSRAMRARFAATLARQPRDSTRNAAGSARSGPTSQHWLVASRRDATFRETPRTDPRRPQLTES